VQKSVEVQVRLLELVELIAQGRSALELEGLGGAEPFYWRALVEDFGTACMEMVA
jgi:hypothetical protein